MEFSIEEKGRMFTVKVDMERLLVHVNNYKEAIVEGDDSDDSYVMNGTEDRVTQAQYDLDMLKFEKDVQALSDVEHLRKIVDRMGRKKDGYFAKGRVVQFAGYNTTAWYDEEAYGWRYMGLRAKSENANTMTITFEQEIDKY
jgi:hypothetical protein